MDYTEEEKGNNVSDAQNTFSQATQGLPSQEKETDINFAQTKGQENSLLKRQSGDFSDDVLRKKQRTTYEVGKQENTELNSYIEQMVSSHSSNESIKHEDRDISPTTSPATQELPSQEKETNINFAHTKGQENSSLKHQNSDFSDDVLRKKQRTTYEVGRQENTGLNSCMELMVSSHSSNESTKLEDRDISPTGLTVRDEWYFSELTKPNHEVSSMESDEKYLEVSFDILENAPSREFFNQVTEEEKGNLSSGTHPKENQISSSNDSILINSDSCESMQVEPSDAIFRAPVASKNLDVESEIKNVLNLEIFSTELPHKVESSFDIKQEEDVIEINPCIGTLTNNDQQCKLDQNENIIDVIMYCKQMENVFNEEKNKNEINGCTSILCSTDKICESDETDFSAPVVGENISSWFGKNSNKLANEMSAGFEDTLFPTLKEMNREEPSTSKLDQNIEVIDVSVYDEQVKNIFNEGKYLKNDRNNCSPNICSTDETHDLDKTIISVPVVEKDISSCFNKVSDNLGNEISTVYEDTLFQQLEEMVRDEPPKSSTYCEDDQSNDEELLSSTLLVDQNHGEFSSNEGNIECENIDQNAVEIENSAHDSNKDQDISPLQFEEISLTSHFLNRSNLNDLSVKRFLLSPSTIGKRKFHHYSQPSSTIQKSNLIQQVIKEFLENLGQQAFTVQEVVDFIMQEFGSGLSYFDAIHSTRIFLRNAVNAKTLKLNDGKYVVKPSVERII